MFWGFFYVHKFLELNGAHIILHYLPAKQAKESNKFSQKTLANLVNVYSLALFLVSFIKTVTENWDTIVGTNVCSKKTMTNRSSVSLLRIVLVFLKHTLS